MYGQVHLSDLGSRRIVFEGVAGTSYMGDIAIDDITVNDGDCPLQDGNTFNCLLLQLISHMA